MNEIDINQGLDCYATMTFENIMETNNEINLLECKRMIEESDIISSITESGIIDDNLLESLINLDKYDILIENALGNAIQKFIENVLKVFRERSLEKAKAYTGWVKEYKDQIIEDAGKHAGVKLMPYMDGEKVTYNDIRDALNAAMMVNEDKMTDYSYAKRLLPNGLVEEEFAGNGNNNKRVTVAFKNYFRYGIKSFNPPEKSTIVGRDLQQLVTKMIKYVGDYEKYSQKVATSLEKSLNDTVKKWTAKYGADDKKIKKKKVNESYLTVEERYVSESLITMACNYQYILEAENENQEKKEDNKPTTKQEKESEDTGKDTKVESQEDEKKDQNKPGEKNSEENKGYTDVQQTYAKNLERFAKLSVSSYISVVEERFIWCINTLKEVSTVTPKLDNKGDYDSEATKEANKKEESEGEKTEENKEETKESFNILRELLR